jgi:hypothetical protein
MEPVMELLLDMEAWEQGFNAGLQLDDQRCPYETESAKAWAWRSGFIEGRAERFRRTAV